MGASLEAEEGEEGGGGETVGETRGPRHQEKEKPTNSVSSLKVDYCKIINYRVVAKVTDNLKREWFREVHLGITTNCILETIRMERY